MTTTNLIERALLGPYVDDLLNFGVPPSIAGKNPLKVDIDETDKEYVVKVDVPGIDREDIDVQVHENSLSISASYDKKVESKDEGDGKDNDKGKQRTIIRERLSGKFERKFRFCENIVPQNVNAKLNDGVLVVTVGKQDPEVLRKERTITIS